MQVGRYEWGLEKSEAREWVDVTGWWGMDWLRCGLSLCECMHVWANEWMKGGSKFRKKHLTKKMSMLSFPSVGRWQTVRARIVVAISENVVATEANNNEIYTNGNDDMDLNDRIIWKMY